MISFNKLGNHGRMGNQFFQYAFLRTQAERLGVKFYCPKWIGDEIFDLKDENIRASAPEGLNKNYNEPFARDYDRNVFNIEDNSDILGYFESEKNFDNTKAMIWFSFKKEKIARVKEKYKDIDFSRSVGIHLRFCDKLIDNKMCVPGISYHLKALEKVGTNRNLLIFSDDIEMAEEYIKKTGLRFIFMEGNEPWEDLYLMSQCRDFIGGASTLSWWGAWLNNNSDKKVVFPKEGLYRTGAPYRNKDFIPNEWIKIRALRPIVDNYIVVNFFPRVHYFIGIIGYLIKRNTPWLFNLLKPYFPNKK